MTIGNNALKLDELREENYHQLPVRNTEKGDEKTKRIVYELNRILNGLPESYNAHKKKLIEKNIIPKSAIVVY